MNDDFPILATVAANPSHPYQMLDHLHQLGVRATRSTLYRRVDALVAGGILVSRDARGESGHVRRNLELTEAGRQRVAAEAVEVLRHEPLESPLFALALNCAEAADTQALPAILRMRMAGAARRLTDEERSLTSGGTEAPYWQRAGQERRVAHLKADLTWLQSVIGRRTAGSHEPGDLKLASSF